MVLPPGCSHLHHTPLARVVTCHHHHGAPPPPFRSHLDGPFAVVAAACVIPVVLCVSRCPHLLAALTSLRSPHCAHLTALTLPHQRASSTLTTRAAYCPHPGCPRCCCPHSTARPRCPHLTALTSLPSPCRQRALSTLTTWAAYCLSPRPPSLPWLPSLPSLCRRHLADLTWPPSPRRPTSPRCPHLTALPAGGVH